MNTDEHIIKIRKNNFLLIVFESVFIYVSLWLKLF